MFDEPIHDRPLGMSYEAPRMLASFAAHEVLAEAETSSVIIVVS